MIKKLKDGYYIDSWYDKKTRSWVVQVKDKNNNEVDCEYCGDREWTAYSIKSFIDEYGGLLNEEADIDKLAKKKAKETLKKTKKSKLNPLATFVLPDAGAGIATFNKNMGVSDLSSTTGSTCGEVSSGDAGSGEASGGMGESLEEAMLPRQELINRIRKLGFNYKFDKYTDAQLYRIYQERVAYVERKKAEDKAQKELAKEHDEFYKNYTDEEDNELVDTGYSLKYKGHEFVSDKEADEFFQ